jgi:3'-phosphoadenosine 5'-phosphosulfate sulfotransferase
MYLAGVSVRRVEDITEALWGTKYHQRLSVIWINKSMKELKPGAIDHLRTTTLMSIWME